VNSALDRNRLAARMSETGNKEQLVTRIFHPISERSRDAWFPGDDGTSLLVAGLHAWEDIERLTRLRTQVHDTMTESYFSSM
jgi:hypothetical protein